MASNQNRDSVQLPRWIVHRLQGRMGQTGRKAIIGSIELLARDQPLLIFNAGVASARIRDSKRIWKPKGWEDHDGRTEGDEHYVASSQHYSRRAGETGRSPRDGAVVHGPLGLRQIDC